MPTGIKNMDGTNQLQVEKFLPQLYLRRYIVGDKLYPRISLTKRAMSTTSVRPFSEQFEKRSIISPFGMFSMMPGLKRQTIYKSLPNTQQKETMETSTKCGILSGKMVGK